MNGLYVGFGVLFMLMGFATWTDAVLPNPYMQGLACVVTGVLLLKEVKD